MHKIFYPQGTCSSRFDIILEDGIVKDLKVTDGCNGNLKGISSLIKGQKAKEVISRLKGIKCGFKNTSCPDQIALALEEALSEEK